jgi:DNA primase
MDVIALHQAGIASAVGICGTAFTDEQATLLRHWAETAVLVLDSDEAGQKAAERAVVTCRKNGLACRLVVSGKDETGEALKDPAEILQKHGGETLKKAMQNTIIDFEYLIARGKKLYDTSIPQGKARAFAMLFPYLDALASEAEKDDCIGAAADLLRIGVEAAKADFRRAGKGKAVAGGTGTGNRIRMNEELFLLTLVAANGELYPEFRAEVALAEIADEAAKELFLVMEECFRNGEAGMDALLAGIGGDALRGFLVARLASDEFKGGAEGFPDCRKMMEDGIKRIRARKLRSRVSEIAGTLRFMERNPEDSGGGNFDDLIAEKMRLDTEIRILEGKQ